MPISKRGSVGMAGSDQAHTMLYAESIHAQKKYTTLSFQRPQNLMSWPRTSRCIVHSAIRFGILQAPGGGGDRRRTIGTAAYWQLDYGSDDHFSRTSAWNNLGGV